MKKTDPKLLLILFIAFAFRLINIAGESIVCDEGLIIAPLKTYFTSGILPFRNWHHPPVRYFFIYLSTLILGENPFAFRLHSIIFGVATVFLCFLLARRFFGEKVAFLAALFLAIDSLHVAFSRLAFEESQLTFFILLSLFLAVKYVDTRKPFLLLPLGLSLGLGFGTKWLFLPILVFVLAYILYASWPLNKPIFFFTLIATLVLLPFAIYLLSFAPWFTRGYTLVDWASFQIHMAQSIMEVTPLDYSDLIGTSYNAFFWFLYPLSFPYLLKGNDLIYSVTAFTNPFLWLFFFPSFAYLIFTGELKKALPLIVAGFCFLLPLLLTSRPIYLYSATPLTPFVVVTVSAALISLYDRLARLRNLIILFVAGAVLFSFFFFPLESGIAVPAKIYQPVIDIYSSLK